MMKHHDQFTEVASQFCRFLLLTADKLCDRQRTELITACGLRRDTIKRA